MSVSTPLRLRPSTRSTSWPGAAVSRKAVSTRSRPTIMLISVGSVDRRDLGAADLPAVAQDGDAIADLGDLLEPVRDVDDRPALGLERADDLEQPAGLAVGQRRGRLVHDHDLGVERQRLGDLDHLSLRDAQLLDRRLRVEIETDARERVTAHRAGSTRVDGAPRGERLASQEQILGDVQVRAPG